MPRTGPGRRCRAWRSSQGRKLLAELRLTYEDGTEEAIGTDESWQVDYSNIFFSNIYDGEQSAGCPDRNCPAAAPRPPGHESSCPLAHGSAGGKTLRCSGPGPPRSPPREYGSVPPQAAPAAPSPAGSAWPSAPLWEAPPPGPLAPPPERKTKAGTPNGSGTARRAIPCTRSASPPQSL